MIYITSYGTKVFKNTKIKYDHTAKTLVVLGKDDWGWFDVLLNFYYADLETIQDKQLIFFVAEKVGEKLGRVFCKFEAWID